MASVRILGALLFLAFLVGCAGDPPGVVIDEVPAPSLVDVLLGKDSYVASPSLAILPDGTYVASHDIFGDGSTQETSGVTRVFRSTDRGESWTQVATLDGQFWSTLFVHEGALYIMGPTASNSAVRDLVIRRSEDAGSTWTTPADETSGLLRDTSPASTPHRPVVHDGRLWIALSTKVASAPVGADLLRADSWTISSAHSQDDSWLDGRFEFWSEGQIVASPATGVSLLPKVNNLPYTARLQVVSPSTITFDPENDFVEFPGAEKKFGATYDPVSARFYALSNPVLPAHVEGTPLQQTPALIRNTAAVLSSADLANWEVERIFLYSANIAFEAFQYLNFELEENDLAVVSRTAFFVGGNVPPRGHDSNLMTFHRIPDFRNLTPKHVLTVDREAGAVLRFEQTQHDLAPLGRFALGTSFDGTPLSNPEAVGQGDDGRVYIRESGGRVLVFDAAGNFLATDIVAPVPLSAGPVAVLPPPDAERTWVGLFDDTTWEEPTSWFYWGRPDTASELAIFGSAEDGPTTITLDRSFAVRGLSFRSAAPYTLTGSGQLVVGGASEMGLLTAERGSHVVRVPVALAGDGAAQIGAGAALTLDDGLDLDSHTLVVNGDAPFTVGGLFSMDGARLELRGGHALVIADGTSLALAGTLALDLSDEPPPVAGDVFDLLDFTPPLGDSFDSIELPALDGGLDWDLSSLYGTGQVAVVSTLR